MNEEWFTLLFIKYSYARRIINILNIVANTPIPELIEVTYIRSDKKDTKSINFFAKNKLDQKNAPGNPDIFWSPAHFFLTGLWCKAAC